MIVPMKFMSKISAIFGHKRGLESHLNVHGFFTIEHFRNGECIRKLVVPNGVTNGGKDEALDILFKEGTAHPKISNWYLGLIDNSGYTGVAAADTMSSHSGWTEFTTYSETLRPEWSPDAASSQSISNSTSRSFNITGSGTLKGGFSCSDSTKSGSSGTLFATALFSSTISVVNGDEIKVTYTVNAS